MHILLVIDAAPCERWQLWIADALRAIPGVRLSVRRESGAPPRPTALTLLLALEALAGRRSREITALDVIAANHAPSSSPPATFDLALDCSGARPATLPAARTLTLLADGEPGTNAIWQALLAGRAPAFALHDHLAHASLPIARSALEDPARLAVSFQGVAVRLVEALATTIRDVAAGRRIAHRAAALDLAPARTSSTAFVANAVRDKARSRLDRLLGQAPKWAIALRVGASGAIEVGPLDLSRYTLLPDDGHRFYADPFLFTHGGRKWLFLEEVPYTTDRGVISVAEVGADGAISPPRCVLERPYHLSYPFVFARDGAVWMLPEATQSGALELYRADPFPYRWDLVARLVELPLADPTLFEHDGRLWIAATEMRGGASSWDALSLFHAEHLLGPWQPHPLNPVSLDCTAARPAGRIVRDAGGNLIRPAQDCVRAYGSAMTINRIDRLDTETFAETRLGRIDAPRRSGLMGPHTLNREAGIEVIDLFGSPRDLAHVGSAAANGYKRPASEPA